ncbi:MAG: acyl-CoA thioesterase [Lachnospiraceae bacterium]|nr:acyl-CoA thioesterase [Lachnospiraceae bacterium]
MNLYKHTVHYYETDKMGITHHSNYIRWMEEARVDFLKKIGWDYAKLEESGVISPVTEVSCKYKATTVFAENVVIEVSVEEFKGVKLRLKYEMKNEKGKVVCIAHSEHCFLDKNGRPMRLNKDLPEFYQTLMDLAQNSYREE